MANDPLALVNSHAEYYAQLTYSIHRNKGVIKSLSGFKFCKCNFQSTDSFLHKSGVCQL